MPVRRLLKATLAILLLAVSGVARSQNFQPDAGNNCWIDAGNGFPPKAVIPLGATVDPFDGKHASGRGQNFFLGPDGWRNSATGKPPDQLFPAGAKPEPMDPKHAHSPGHNWVLVPCPPPGSVRAPLTSSAAPASVKKLSLAAGVTFGAIGRTDTYDDGYKAGGTTSSVGFNFSAIEGAQTNPVWGNFQPPTPSFFFGGDIRVEVPLQTATVTTTQTRLDGSVMLDAIFGESLKHAHHTFSIWGSFGGGIGVVKSGYTSPSYSYSDTETLKGITFAVGASTPIHPGSPFSFTTEVRYIDLFNGTFAAPGSTYQMKDSGIGGSVGVEWRFH